MQKLADLIENMFVHCPVCDAPNLPPLPDELDEDEVTMCCFECGCAEVPVRK
jgi:hypothetical protein